MFLVLIPFALAILLLILNATIQSAAILFVAMLFVGIGILFLYCHLSALAREHAVSNRRHEQLRQQSQSTPKEY